MLRTQFQIQCKCCRAAILDAATFQNHRCPCTVPTQKGEAFDAYSLRCDAQGEEWRDLTERGWVEVLMDADAKGLAEMLTARGIKPTEVTPCEHWDDMYGEVRISDRVHIQIGPGSVSVITERADGMLDFMPECRTFAQLLADLELVGVWGVKS